MDCRRCRYAARCDAFSVSDKPAYKTPPKDHLREGTKQDLREKKSLPSTNALSWPIGVAGVGAGVALAFSHPRDFGADMTKRVSEEYFRIESNR
jgi:hypothetical protein